VSALERLWWHPAPSWGERVLLAPLGAAEAVFRVAAAVRSALYDRGLLGSEEAGVPVISVGNLAVGGSGKTPVALALAERLTLAGRRPAVLSRGHGATSGAVRVVSDGERVLLSAAEGGDEPVLLARRVQGLRVVCGPDRAALARLAVDRLGADVLLLDDGFQHRRLRRDLDVVVLDASNPWGNGHCLPRGPNREPPGALSRAGLVWLTHVDRAAGAGGRRTGDGLGALRDLARAHTGRDPVESRHAARDLVDGELRRSFGLGALAGRRVALLTGVARPGSVRRTVEDLGAVVAVARDYPDHHRFALAEVEEALAAAAAAGAGMLVTTEKDAVRLPAGRAGDERIRALRIEVEVLRGGATLQEALAAALEGGAGTGARAGAAAAPAAAARKGS
jgi:tetraacyldisaccharide 4'-kinase